MCDPTRAKYAVFGSDVPPICLILCTTYTPERMFLHRNDDQSCQAMQVCCSGLCHEILRFFPLLELQFGGMFFFPMLVYVNVEGLIVRPFILEY